jgi:outer membrane protein
MKKIAIIVAGIFLSQSLWAQITLKECIERGLSNKSNIKIAKSDQLLASLKSMEAKGKYLPQISFTYDYRYNPIIATQVVPVGQFNPVPTSETRGIQFGTNWQQNAGLTVYQPIVDLAVQSRIKESRLKESLASIDLQKAENDLQFEITKAYSNVLGFAFQVDESVTDTARSFKSFAIVSAKFKEGKVLKTELNTAAINHNNNVIAFRKAMAALVNEKIYVHYLSNIDLEKLLEQPFAPLPVSFFDSANTVAQVQIDSVPEYQKLVFRQQLLGQQIKTEGKKYTPSVGLQGFLGANQFSQEFVPFQSSSWFGSSYVGIFIKLPIFSPDKSINGAKQLKMQLTTINYEKEELKSEKNRQLLQANIEIERLGEELKIKKGNLILLEENVSLYQQRMQNGQLATAELNLQESDLQRLRNQINQIQQQLSKALAERLFVLGELNRRLQSL